MYRDYCELTENEKDELRNALFFASLYNRDDSYYSALSAEEQTIIDDCMDASDISESIMLSAFDGIAFVDEDFFCNIQDGNYDGCGAVYA